MKKISIILITLIMMAFGGVVCFASIIPSEGPGQIGLSSVVLCDSLSLHQEPSFNSASTQTLRYGDRIIVMSQSDGWARVVLGDSEDSPSGWVDVDYIAVDPAWYRCDGDTPVYAWDDTGSKKVAFLDEGTTLPILRDDGNWIIVSLRGATGWINNPGRSTTTMYGSGSSSADADENGAVAVVYDENGESYTLYEGTDGYWRDRSGTAYDRLSDTEFQVHEGTKRLSVNDPSQADYAGENSGESAYTAFTVYARDGSTALIHPTGGAMYEDAKGRTYVKDDQDGFFYCITTDTTYAFDPTQWTGEAYGENEFPAEGD